jgi:hypothetical protein
MVVGGTVDRLDAGEDAAVPDLVAALHAAATPAPAAVSAPNRMDRRDNGDIGARVRAWDVRAMRRVQL